MKIVLLIVMRTTNMAVSATDHHPSRVLGHPKIRRLNG